VQLHQYSNLNLSSRQPVVREVWCRWSEFRTAATRKPQKCRISTFSIWNGRIKRTTIWWRTWNGNRSRRRTKEMVGCTKWI